MNKNNIFTNDEISLERVINEYKHLFENHMWRRWAKWYRDYLLDWSDRENSILPFQSNIKVPIVKQYVDALWTSVYDNQINFKTTWRNKESYKKASNAHDYLAWAFTRSKSWSKLMDAVKECVIEWNWYVKIWFMNNTINHSYSKFVKDKKTGKLKKKDIEWKEVEKFPDLSYVSIFNVFYPMHIDSIQDSPVVIERSIIHKSKLLERYKHLKLDKWRFTEATKNPKYIFNYDFDKK